MSAASTKARHFLLIAIGSAGDVHPFVGLGQALQRRGHRATIVTTGFFESLVRGAGLGFVELTSADHYLQMIQRPELFQGLKAPAFVMRHAIGPVVQPVYQIIAEHRAVEPLTVVASSLAFGARVAQDKLGVPTATIHLQPVVLRSYRRPVRLPGMLTGSWVPPWLVRLQFWFADKVVIDRLLGPQVNGLRSELGLPPVSRLFGGYMHSPTLAVGLWPEWFAPPQPEWPSQVRLTGFPLYDERDVVPLGAEVEAFLAAGSPPIAFTPGSAMVHSREFFTAAVEACRRLGRRGILLTRHSEQLPTPIPAYVRHFDFVPFSQLLPRCAAVVHHGGIGSLSQAMAAGVPQVVMSMAHDQFDNAARAEGLGVGIEVSAKQFNAETLTAALMRLIDRPEVTEACRQVAARLAGNTALDDTARLVESLG